MNHNHFIPRAASIAIAVFALHLALAKPSQANFKGDNVREHPEWFLTMFLEKGLLDRRMLTCLAEIKANRNNVSQDCEYTIAEFNKILNYNQFGKIGKSQDSLPLVERLIEIILRGKD